MDKGFLQRYKNKETKKGDTQPERTSVYCTVLNNKLIIKELPQLII